MPISDVGKVTIHVQDGKYKVENVNIVASIRAMNGVVQVIDAVLVPPPKVP